MKILAKMLELFPLLKVSDLDDLTRLKSSHDP